MEMAAGLGVKPMNSRAKGKRGELELAEFLRDHGFPDARRGQQFHGGPGSPDVISEHPALANTHLECKRVEAGNLYVWMDQARRDAGNKVPVVAHKRNGEDWVAILPLSSLLFLLQSLGPQ